MMESDLDKGFDANETNKLVDYQLSPPSAVFESVINNKITLGDYDSGIGQLLKKLGQQKGTLSKDKSKAKNMDKTDQLNQDIKLIQKYRSRIRVIEDGKRTIGKGFKYTQPKRNAYKRQGNGQYGNLVIDIPKLLGQLHLVAIKDGKKVIDRLIDFDTIDLLTKRFNSKKKYSPLSKMVFNQLNKLSEIPIRRTSLKYQKIGSAVVYYNNVNGLMDRLELLGGSILAGNNGLKNEFSQIALNKLSF